jgi:hypothetical protein
MKNLKTKEELEQQYYLVYGGKNTKTPPFNVGDIIKQKYTLDDSGNIIDGKSKFEFVGMKGDMMLLKTLNISAAYSEDTTNKTILKKAKKAGYKPEIGQITQLHYMYADRYEIIN